MTAAGGLVCTSINKDKKEIKHITRKGAVVTI